MLDESLSLDEYAIVYLRQATNYYKEDRYPNPYYALPPMDEIKAILVFTEELFDNICTIIDIDKELLI